MATIKPELKTILDKYGINPSDKSQLWDCHGVMVLYHKAYEIIAAKERISFDAPTIIEGNTKERTVAVVVVGRMGDRSEWSIGEAAPANNKNSYPYAMAEKRGKDRVIAKLVGLSAYVYSEDEADDFKAANPSLPPSGVGATQAEVAQRKTLDAAGWKAKAVAFVKAADDACANSDALYQWQLAHQGELDEIRGRSRALADWIAEGLLKIHAKLTEKAA